MRVCLHIQCVNVPNSGCKQTDGEIPMGLQGDADNSSVDFFSEDVLHLLWVVTIENEIDRLDD